MKKIFLILFLLISAFCFGQGPFPLNATSGTPGSGVLTRGRLSVDSLLQLNTTCFTDTTAANRGRIDEIGGAMIRTCNNTIWLRNTTATRWVGLGSSGSISNITFLTDSTLIICYTSGVCDTISFTNNIFITNSTVVNTIHGDTLISCTTTGNVTVCDTLIFTGGGDIFNYYYINDSTAVLCGDTLIVFNGDTAVYTQVCDTINIPRIRTILYAEGINNQEGGIVKLGSLASYPPSWFNANRDINTFYYTMSVGGHPLYDYPFKVQQKLQSFFGGGIAAFKQAEGIHLGINYATDTVLASPVYNGSLGNRTGFWIGANISGSVASSAPNILLSTDNPSSKYGGLFINTLDPQNTESFTLFGAGASGSTFIIGLDTTKIFTGHTTKQLQAWGYGSTSNFMVTDTTSYKPALLGSDGKLYRSTYWYGGGGGSNNDSLFARQDASNATGGQLYFDNAGEYFGLDNINQFEWGLKSGGFNIYDYDASGYPVKFDSTTSFRANTKYSFVGGDLYRTRFDVANSLSGFRLNSRTNGTRVEMAIENTSTPAAYMVADNLLGSHSFHVIADTAKVQMSIDPLSGSSIKLKINTVGLIADNLPAGALTDSVLTRDPVTGAIRYRNASSFGGGFTTADNGLTANTATNVRLGGTLLVNTTIATVANTLTVSTATGGVNPLAVTSTSGNAIFSQSPTGYALVAYSSSTGTAVQAWSDEGLPLDIQKSAANASTPVQMINIARQTSGAAADGIGSSIDFQIETTTSVRESNKLISKLTTSADATRTSQFIITGVNNAVTGNKLIIEGDGRIYGTGLHNSAGAVTGTTNQYLASGTFTSIISASTNTDAAVTVEAGQWIRTGNVITYSFSFTADPTTPAAATSFEFTLPVASNITQIYNVMGTAFCGAVAGQGAAVNGVVANDTGKVFWVSGDVTNQTWAVTVTYVIL